MVIADRNSLSIDDKKWFNKIENVVDVPNLLEIQTESFNWLKGPGILELIEEISPIEDFSGGRFEVRLIDHEIREPEFNEEQCREREITFQAPLQALDLRSAPPCADLSSQFCYPQVLCKLLQMLLRQSLSTNVSRFEKTCRPSHHT